MDGCGQSRRGLGSEGLPSSSPSGSRLHQSLETMATAAMHGVVDSVGAVLLPGCMPERLDSGLMGCKRNTAVRRSETRRKERDKQTKGGVRGLEC
jgi:hypothetical protein